MAICPSRWIGLLSLLACVVGTAPLGAAELISINAAGTDTASGGAFGSGFPPDVSADGRFVAFANDADDLVAGLDSNGAFDVFVRDRLLGTTELISINTSGTNSGDDFSTNPTISDDGRFVAFWSAASDLVATDSNDAQDVFVHDRLLGTTTLVSVNQAGTDSGSGSSRLPIISPNGASVVFLSQADDLVATADTNGADDVFVRDLMAGTTLMATINAGGTDSGAGASAVFTEVPSISADGRRVVFPSDATDLVAGDANGVADVFLFDLDTGSTTLLSPTIAGIPGANGASSVPAISADGLFVAFASLADNLVATDTNGDPDVFVRDLIAGTTALVSTPTGGTDSVAGGVLAVGPSSISADGNLIAFTSFADGLVVGDGNATGDVFLRDRTAGTTTLVSATPAGTSGDRESFVLAAFSTAFSADGRYVTFVSNASDLTVEVDTNATADIFQRDLANGTTAQLNLSINGTAPTGASFNPTQSTDGSIVVFLSNAADIVPVDTNVRSDVFAGFTDELLFADGFESGDTAAWTMTVP